MTRGDLVREYLTALQRVTIDDVRALMAHRIPFSSIELVLPVPMLIRLNAAGTLYQPDLAGRAAWVLPIRSADPLYPEEIETADPPAVVKIGAVVDFLAFTPEAPGQWALRLGDAPVLGAIEPQYLNPAPVRVDTDVSAWLRAGCSGIMLLTSDPCEAGRILRRCAGVEAQDEAHKVELRRLIERPAFIDTIVKVRSATRRLP